MSQTVLITGASGGIGSATAKAFASAGYKVAIHYNSNADAANSLKKEINVLGGECAVFKADISDSTQVKTMFHDIKKTLGEVDVLVNNAGTGRQIMFQDISDELWHNTFGVNVDGAFYCCREALSDMIRKKSKIGGSNNESILITDKNSGDPRRKYPENQRNAETGQGRGGRHCHPAGNVLLPL